jgi:hypothetical protein
MVTKALLTTGDGRAREADAPSISEIDVIAHSICAMAGAGA